MATFPMATWERSLLSLAFQGRGPSVAPTPGPLRDPAVLECAYRHCEALTSLHSRSFSLATCFLPRQKRRAVRALYAFCRVTDDIVDGAAKEGPDPDPGGTPAPSVTA